MRHLINSLASLALLLLLSTIAGAQSDPWDITEDDILAAQEEIYEGLFGDPWTAGVARYWLDTPAYSGELGTIQGSNENGLPFQFVIKSAEVIDLNTLGLERSVLLNLQQQSYTFASVEGSIVTPLSSFEITARIISFEDAQGTGLTRLLVGIHVNAIAEAIAAWKAANPPAQSYWGTIKIVALCFDVVTGTCIAETPECEACWDWLQTEIAVIQGSYDADRQRLDAGLEAADNAWEDCDTGAYRDYLDAINGAWADYVDIGENQCLGDQACWDAIDAELQVALVASDLAWEQQKQDCDDTYKAAEAQYAADLQALNSQYEQDMEQAQQDYEDCLELNNCNTPCIVTVCLFIAIVCP